MTDSPTEKPEPASEALREITARKDAQNRNKWVAAGVATGIGSAAIVAAMMFVNRKGKDKAPK
ncbi:MAG: hypothetical protein ACKVOP_05585 [Sphingomonadaceae bacterium]